MTEELKRHHVLLPNNPQDLLAESTSERFSTGVWSMQSTKNAIVPSEYNIDTMSQRRSTGSVMFPKHPFPTVRAKAGLLPLALLAATNQDNQLVQLRTQCRELGSFGPDLPKIATDIVRDSESAVGSVPCSALIYQIEKIEPHQLEELDSLVYAKKNEDGRVTYLWIARTLRPKSADVLLGLSEPRYATYTRPDALTNLDELDELEKVATALSFIQQQPLVDLYTAIQIYEDTDAYPDRSGPGWENKLKKNQKRFCKQNASKNTNWKSHQDLFKRTLHALNRLQPIRASTVFGDGRFRVGFCALTGDCEMVGERAGLLPVDTLHHLNVLIRKEQCHVDLIVAPKWDKPLWAKQNNPDESYPDEGQPYTRRCVRLLGTMAVEKQISLERARTLAIPDRMRAADSHTMFDTDRPWSSDKTAARDHLDKTYDQIARVTFPEGGRGAWTGKLRVGDDDDEGDSTGTETANATRTATGPAQKKSKVHKKLQNVAILKMPKNYGLRLLNFRLMKEGAKKREQFLKDVAPPDVQDDWYKQAEKWCASWRHGRTAQLIKDDKVMEDCAVISSYVTYAVGLWLMDADPSEHKAWEDLKLYWHKLSLSTKKDVNDTDKQAKVYQTSGLPKTDDPDPPTLDLHVTTADISCEFVIWMLKELVFPVYSVVEAVRNVEILHATPGSTEDNTTTKLNSKHPWMLQLIIARLYSHLIKLSSHPSLLHGLALRGKQYIPLHSLMARLGHLIRTGEVQVCFPELLLPTVYRSTNDGVRYYPNQNRPLRVKDITIAFHTTNPNNTDDELPRAFPELLEYCQNCISKRRSSKWRDLLVAETPDAIKPEAKPFPGKRSRDDNESGDRGGRGSDGSGDTSTATATPTREPGTFRLPEAEQRVLQTIVDSLDTNRGAFGGLMQVMRDAFRQNDIDATLLYLNRVLGHIDAESDEVVDGDDIDDDGED